MSRSKRARIFVPGCFVLALLAPTAARAGSIFIIETDTSPILADFGSGYTGYIDLQFNANAGADFATATIFGFSSDGSLTAPTYLIGDASGNLATTVTIGNGALDASGYNDYNQAFTFGTFVKFEITLAGPALNASGNTAGSAFSLSFYGSDDETNLLSTDLSGASAMLDIEPSGTVTPFTYAAGDNNVYTTITAVPEPRSVLLLAAGLLLLAAGASIRFRRRKSLSDGTPGRPPLFS